MYYIEYVVCIELHCEDPLSLTPFILITLTHFTHVLLEE